MPSAKLIAMCVCPALAAPPAIMAVSPPARHRVAHALHRAADRLEPRHALAQAAASLPCAPVIAASFTPLHLADALPAAPPAEIGPETIPPILGARNIITGGSGSGGIPGGGGGAIPVPALPPVEGVPDPATWMLLGAGFITLGVAVRRRRPWPAQQLPPAAKWAKTGWPYRLETADVRAPVPRSPRQRRRKLS